MSIMACRNKRCTGYNADRATNCASIFPSGVTECVMYKQLKELWDWTDQWEDRDEAGHAYVITERIDGRYHGRVGLCSHWVPCRWDESGISFTKNGFDLVKKADKVYVSKNSLDRAKSVGECLTFITTNDYKLSNPVELKVVE